MSEKSELKEVQTDISLEWRIKEFMSLPKEVGYCMKSATFSLSDAKWCFDIYPNGETDDDIGWISLFLWRECLSTYTSSPQNSVSFTIGIQKCNGSVHKSIDLNSDFTECEGYGCPRLVKTPELHDSKDILDADGTLTVFCTVRIRADRLLDTSVEETACKTSSLEKEEEPSESSIKILQKNLKDLFLSGRHGDVTIKVKDQEFQVHRFILVARSSVFSAMFEHDTEEKKTGIVNIDDCCPDPFKAFLSFLYNGNLEVVSSINALELYKIADKYDLNDLKDECVRCLAKDLCEANFCDVVLLATMHNESQLLETATDFFIENVKAILPSPAWLSLATDHVTLTNELHIKLVNRKL